MNLMTKTRFEVVPLTKHIGAELRGIDLRQKPDERDRRGDLPGLARSSGDRSFRDRPCRRKTWCG